GGRLRKFKSADALAEMIAAQWPAGRGYKYVVLTGGEPLLQVDTPLLDALHAQGFEVAVETNGSISAPQGIDWICVSPKAGAPWIQEHGNELKLAYPQSALLPESIPEVQFEAFFLQPIDGSNLSDNTRAAIAYCQENPKWCLSLQTHKILNIR
ncbi:MAG: 7-carboxy-7-deazaguanine synthase QueE, partial [Nitrososphaerales archaeon]